MTLGTILVGGVILPLPTSWLPVPGRGSYAGIEGLLDPRVVGSASREDAGVQEEIIRRGGEGSDITVQGRACRRSRYLNRGATVCTYSIDIGNNMELRAVYVFRSGYESAIADIDAALISGV